MAKVCYVVGALMIVLGFVAGGGSSAQGDLAGTIAGFAAFGAGMLMVPLGRLCARLDEGIRGLDSACRLLHQIRDRLPEGKDGESSDSGKGQEPP